MPPILPRLGILNGGAKWGREKCWFIKWSFVFLAATILLGGIAYGQTDEEFEKVTTALNTPALLDEYLKKNFRWASEREGGGWPIPQRSIRTYQAGRSMTLKIPDCNNLKD